jgi:hypothetical protein
VPQLNAITVIILNYGRNSIAILAAMRRRRTHKREAPMTPIDRGEQSTVSTNHRLAIVVMVSAGLLSCGTSPPLARDGPGGLLAYFHAGAMDGGCQAEHMTSASGHPQIQSISSTATGRCRLMALPET